MLDHTNGVVVSFLRGLDLSGSMQGAGGVGGLLAVGCPTNGTHFVAYDGNGNVSALVSASDGTVSAEYAYGPFGEPVCGTGPMAKANPIRFSTQYADDATGDLKYLFRDYEQSVGRWLSRDPIEERGGINLYGLAGNDSLDGADPLGLRWIYTGVPPVMTWVPDDSPPPDGPGMPNDPPTFAVGLIPVYGSSLNSIYNFSQGNGGWGTFYSAMAVSDAFLARSIVTGLGKGCWKVGSHTWKATRSWYGRTRALASGTEVHHWLLHQNEGLGRWFPEWFKNQPWNLVVVDGGVVNGTRYSSKTIHLAIHGTSRRLTLEWYERALYGTPEWAQWAALDFSMHASTVFEQDCECSRQYPGQTVIKDGGNIILLPSEPSPSDPVLSD